MYIRKVVLKLPQRVFFFLCEAVPKARMSNRWLLANGTLDALGVFSLARPVAAYAVVPRSIAKVVCDKIMCDLALEHTVYGWKTNADYGMPAHLAGIERHGVFVHHRQSFRPISQTLSIRD